MSMGRWLLRFLGYGAAFVIGTLVLLGLVGYSFGAISVSVTEKQPGGHHLWVPVPALVVPVGLRFVPREDLREAAAKLRPWLPAIRAASVELEKCDDARLVEVKNHEEHVTIEKHGGYLVIDVDSEEEKVHVSVPLAIAAEAVEEIGRVEDADDREGFRERQPGV